MKQDPQTAPGDSAMQVQDPKVPSQDKKVAAKPEKKPMRKTPPSGETDSAKLKNDQPEQDLQLQRMQEMVRKRKQLERKEWGRKQQRSHDGEILALSKQLDAARSAYEKTETDHRELVNKMRTLITKMTAVKKQSDETIKQLESELTQENEKRLSAGRAVAELKQINSKHQEQIKSEKEQRADHQTAFDELTEQNQAQTSKNASLKRSVAKLEKEAATEQGRLTKTIGDLEARGREETQKLQQQLGDEKSRAAESIRGSQENFKQEIDKLKSVQDKLQGKLDQTIQESEQSLTDERRQSGEQINQLEDQLAGVSTKLESSVSELDTRLAAEREAKESAAHSLAMETEERVQAEARVSELERMLDSETTLHTKSFKKASRLATDQRLMKSRMDELKSQLQYEKQESGSLTAQVKDLSESERNLRLEVADIQASLSLAERASTDAISITGDLQDRLKQSEAQAADQQARLRSESVRNDQLQSALADERSELTTSRAKTAELESLYKTESEALKKLNEQIGILRAERDELEVKLATVTAEYRTEVEAKRGFEKERNHAVEELKDLRADTIKDTSRHHDFQEQAAAKVEECLMQANRNASGVQAEFSKINTGRRKLREAIAALDSFHQESESVELAFQDQWQTENGRLVSLVKDILKVQPVDTEEQLPGDTASASVKSKDSQEAKDESEELPGNASDTPGFLIKTRALVSDSEEMSEGNNKSTPGQGNEETPSWLKKFGRSKG